MANASKFPPGAVFLPSEDSLSRKQAQVLEVLMERGVRGVTKPDAPEHVRLSLAARIFELRRQGYRIDTKPEWLGDSRIARYVLVSTDSGPREMDAS